jgi:CDP-paratose 2-epimerase
VLDFARSFGIPAAVLRMSCIYGRRQRGTEDQGWVAHFLLRAMAGEPVTIYGDGRQVRDILFVDDAVEAYVAAWRRIGAVAGRAFNLGGGPANAVSLLDVVGCIERTLGAAVEVRFGDWRPGDQRYFVSDTRLVSAELGLRKPLPWRQGIAALAASYAEERKASPRMVVGAM